MSEAARGDRLLLDTHALIWFVMGTLRPEAADRLLRAGAADGLLVSSVSAWEIGLLGAERRDDRPHFDPDPRAWFARAMALPGVREIPLTAAMGLEAAFLPKPFHKDPADRLLVATARQLDVPIVTRDRQILDYAGAGNVTALPC
jgi:PIN domain nuclease of toxin-antitoxin system